MARVWGAVVGERKARVLRRGLDSHTVGVRLQGAGPGNASRAKPRLQEAAGFLLNHHERLDNSR